MNGSAHGVTISTHDHAAATAAAAAAAAATESTPPDSAVPREDRLLEISRQLAEMSELLRKRGTTGSVAGGVFWGLMLWALCMVLVGPFFIAATMVVAAIFGVWSLGGGGGGGW